MTKRYAFGAALIRHGLSPGAGFPMASPNPWGPCETSGRRRDDWHYVRLGIWAASLLLSVLAWYWLLRGAIDVVSHLANLLI